MEVFSCGLDYLLDMAKIIRENSFEGGAGGSSGTLNYSTGYGTPGGGNNSQSSDKFSNNVKTINHMNNESSSSMVTGQLPERPDRKSAFPEKSQRKSSSGSPIHPGDMPKQGNDQPGEDPETPNTVEFGGTSELPDDNTSTTDPDTKAHNDTTDPDPDNKPLDPTKGFDNQVNKIFTKKVTPTPDEILSALQWEMNQMVKKDKYIAKQMVLKNLKSDPKYYARLNMLNIDDDKMKVDESKKTTTEKTKAVLDQMISDRKNRAKPIQNFNEINTIFDDLRNKRYGDKNRK